MTTGGSPNRNSVSEKLKFVISAFMISVLASCAPDIDRNLENLKLLKPDMSKEEVRKYMGEPMVNEIYNQENVWFYHTQSKWSDGNVTSDECTPLVFEKGKLVGWGGEFYKNYKHRNW